MKIGTRSSSLVYGLLLAVWGIVVGWQAMEHRRVKESARSALINRARDITATLRAVIGSQSWRGVVLQERVELALKELVKSGELTSVALLNAQGATVASAGPPIDTRGMNRAGQRWGNRSVALMNAVDLGAHETPERDTGQRTIVLPRREPSSGTRDDPPGAGRTGRKPGEAGPANGVVTTPSTTNTANQHAPSKDGEGRPRSRRPPPSWMVDTNEFKALMEKRGLHGFVMVMSTQTFQAACTQDLWLRWIIGGFGGISVAGLGLAWRNVQKSSDLQMRLLRASEMNSYLREMNVAAAGLAHETRNPLNIIRGLAQIISKESEAPPEVRKRSCEITDEVDRVTAQLNEFINYSKPREVRRAPVALNSVVGDVVRALQSDLEDKAIKLERVEENLTVEGDEQFLRQVLFNLLLNAVQAVEMNGTIQIITKKAGAAEASLEVRDNGPGVPLEQRKEIFKPYFTTHQKGTGLGLAVVQQIVLAHGWEIECQSNDGRGAVFRISRMRLTSKA